MTADKCKTECEGKHDTQGCFDCVTAKCTPTVEMEKCIACYACNHPPQTVCPTDCDTTGCDSDTKADVDAYLAGGCVNDRRRLEDDGRPDCVASCWPDCTDNDATHARLFPTVSGDGPSNYSPSNDSPGDTLVPTDSAGGFLTTTPAVFVVALVAAIRQ